mgnify:CR=1 FL=1
MEKFRKSNLATCLENRFQYLTRGTRGRLLNVMHSTDYSELFARPTIINISGMSDIKNTLDQGGRVIVAVDSMVLWTEGYGNYPVYGMDHAIEVIGIDDSNPNDIRVIINDSGIENGGGHSVSYLEFMEAWQPSGGFMVSAFPSEGKEEQGNDDSAV